MNDAGDYVKVIAKSIETSRGIFNPLTMDDHIVVDGVLATVYTQDLAPSLFQTLTKPLKFIFTHSGVNILGDSLDAADHAWYMNWLQLMPWGQRSYETPLMLQSVAA
jgi:hypothetical protein